MARVILAMASSSMTRCGRLLSSAIARGTAFGSTLRAPRWAVPGVASLAAACFMGDEVSAFVADPEDGDIESGAPIAAALSDLVCACCFASGGVMLACLAACLGCGYCSM